MTRLRLKQASGWFAAGREVALALETLSAEAFRLYLYLCLYAERQTGQTLWNPDDIAHWFQCGSEQVRTSMAELCRQEVCALVGDAAVEIRDRFWPYERLPMVESTTDQASYLEQVRQ